MIIRNKSAPKLATAVAKEKVKETIRIAMGRSAQKEHGPGAANSRPSRSSSTRSLQMLQRCSSTDKHSSHKRSLEISTEDIRKKVSLA